MSVAFLTMNLNFKANTRQCPKGNYAMIVNAEALMKSTVIYARALNFNQETYTIVIIKRLLLCMLDRCD